MSNILFAIVFISTLLGTYEAANGDENVTTTIATEVTIANVTELPTSKRPVTKYTILPTTPATNQSVTNSAIVPTSAPDSENVTVTLNPATTVTQPTTTVTKPTTTATQPTESTHVTTQAPATTTTKPITTEAPHTTDLPVTTSTPQHGRRFDGPSFIGGIVLACGLMAIGFVAFKFYKARTERNYHTL